MKLQAGKRYIRRDGGVSGELVYNPKQNTHYPYVDSATDETYTEDGSFYKTEIGNQEFLEDLVEEFAEPVEISWNTSEVFDSDSSTPKKALNFWEAREAAKQGKAVKRLTNQHIYQPKAMLDPDYSWSSVHFESEWEIAQDHKTYYINVYSQSLGLPKATKALAEITSSSTSLSPLLSCIEITVDEKGKFIKGENV
jgi:hypothetical protein